VTVGKSLKLREFLTFLTACMALSSATLPWRPAAGAEAPPPAAVSPDYLIGPGDSLHVFVFQNEELSVTVPVRPDGKISTPLVEDMVAVGKTPSQ
jgi:polysaccharide export outer membrane protein